MPTVRTDVPSNEGPLRSGRQQPPSSPPDVPPDEAPVEPQSKPWRVFDSPPAAPTAVEGSGGRGTISPGAAVGAPWPLEGIRIRRDLALAVGLAAALLVG